MNKKIHIIFIIFIIYITISTIPIYADSFNFVGKQYKSFSGYEDSELIMIEALLRGARAEAEKGKYNDEQIENLNRNIQTWNNMVNGTSEFGNDNIIEMYPSTSEVEDRWNQSIPEMPEESVAEYERRWGKANFFATVYDFQSVGEIEKAYIINALEKAIDTAKTGYYNGQQISKEQIDVLNQNISNWNAIRGEYKKLDEVAYQEEPGEPEDSENNLKSYSKIKAEIKSFVEQYIKNFDSEAYDKLTIEELEAIGNEVNKYEEDNAKELKAYKDNIYKDFGYLPTAIFDRISGLLSKKITDKQNEETNTGDKVSGETILGTANEYVKEGATVLQLSDMAEEVVAVGKVLVAVGGLILLVSTIAVGVRYIASEPNGKANLRNQLWGVGISTVVIFGAYVIWDFMVKFAFGLFQK